MTRLLAKRTLIAITLGWLAVTQIAIWTMPVTAHLDRDEGYNLIKAALVSQGHALYRDIWSDQPPLFTYMMAITDRWVGSGDHVDRALVSVHAAALVGAVGYVAMRFGGHAGAGVLATLLLLSARQMGKLSMALMIGLPALAWAVVAVAIAMAGVGRRRGWILLPVAGAIFAGGMLIKFFAGILIPFAIAACIWQARRREVRIAPWQTVAQVLLMLAVLGGVVWLAGPFREPAWKTQLVDVHMTRLALEGHDAIRSILARFGEDAPLLLSTIGLAILAGREGWSRSWPAAVWLVTSVVALSQANPVWGHHRVMLVTPLAIWAGASFGVLLPRLAAAVKFRDLPPRWLSHATIGAIFVALAFGLGVRSHDLVTSGRLQDEQFDPRIYATLRDKTRPGDTLMTDDPHIAVVLGLRVPPDTAVWSFKREAQGLMSMEALLASRDRYKPNAILLARKPFPDALPDDWEAQLTVGYELALRRAHRRLYLRIDG